MAITRVSLYMQTLKNLDNRKGKWKFSNFQSVGGDTELTVVVELK